MIRLFDSHTHLNNDTFSDEERDLRAREIEASDVGIIMDIGYDFPSSLRSIEHSKKYPWCYSVIGVHPHDSKTMDEAMLDDIRKLALENGKVMAIGEIGLDYYYDKSERDVQRYWFRRQIQLAKELDLPIVIHSRDADQETFDILKEEEAYTQRVDIHCFSGSKELAKEYLKLGVYLGFDGPITFKNNRKTVEVCEVTPLDRILIETDAPYLTPVPFRGKPNKSEYVEYVARRIAEIKGISFEEVCEATFANGCRFFGIEDGIEQ